MTRIALTLLVLLTLAVPARAQTPDNPTYAQVHAMFAKHSLSCPDAKEEEGGLILETHASLMKGGDTGAAIVPGKSKESLLLKLVRHEKKPYMPPPKKADKLSDAEIAVIAAWVDAGAPAGDPGAPIV